MVVSAPQNPAESSQFLDQTSIAVLSIQAHHPLGTRKLLLFYISLYVSNSTLEIPPVVAIACSPKGAQPLMRVRLQHSGAGPDPFTSFASEIARRTHLAQPSVGRRMIWSLRQSPLARGLPRPIDIKDQPLVAVPIPMSTWLLGRHRPGEHIFQQQGAQGIHRGLVKAGEKAGEGRTMREPLASKQRHEGGGKGKQTIQEVFQGAFATKGLPKTKLSQYGKLCQEKKAWRDKSGTDRGSQSASVEHGQGTQGERTADVYGADGASSRRRRPEASRTRTGLESCHYSQREA